MNAFDVPRVFQRDGREVRQCLEQIQITRIESLRAKAIYQLDYTQARIAKLYRDGDDRLRFHFRLLVDLAEKPCVLGGVRHYHRFAVLRHPSGDSLPYFDAHILERLGRLAHRQLKVKLLLDVLHARLDLTLEFRRVTVTTQGCHAATRHTPTNLRKYRLRSK